METVENPFLIYRVAYIKKAELPGQTRKVVMLVQVENHLDKEDAMALAAQVMRSTHTLTEWDVYATRVPNSTRGVLTTEHFYAP